MAIINTPPNHHKWVVNHHQKWVVHGIAIPTLLILTYFQIVQDQIFKPTSHQFQFEPQATHQLPEAFHHRRVDGHPCCARDVSGGGPCLPVEA